MSKCLGWILAVALAAGIAGCAGPMVTTSTVVIAGVGPAEIEQMNVDVGVILGARRARKGAKPAIIYSEAVSGPPFHNLPDKFVVRTLTVTAKFQGFDPGTGVVSFVGPLGTRSLTVVDPVIKQELTRMRRGDMIELNFAEAFHFQKI